MNALTIVLAVFLTLALTPRALYPWVIAVTVPVYAWLAWVIARPLPSSDDWGELDRALISFAMLVGIVPVFVRLLIDNRRAAKNELIARDWRPAQASSIFVATWAGGWLLTPEIPTLLGGITCLVAGAVLAFALLCAARTVSGNRLWYASAGTALLLGIAVVALSPVVIIHMAEQRAAGRPYCLVVADGINYRVVRDMIDLTPLVMRGREGGRSAANFHGELIIPGEKRRNWSYRNSDFVDEAGDHEPPNCRPENQFSRRLAWY